MVKHGHNKKRRAGRIGRTKLKNRSYATWNPNPKITDATVKKLWNVKRTPAQNLAAMGLALTPNPEHYPAGTDHPTNRWTDGHVTTNIVLWDVPPSDDLTASNNKKRNPPLTGDEQKYMIQCLQKHGTNYTAMFRDTKVNTMQHTEAKLRQLASRFLLLERDQMCVDEEKIPESVQQLMMATTTANENNTDDDDDNDDDSE